MVALGIVWQWVVEAADQAVEARRIRRLRAAANAAVVILPEAVEARACLAEIVVAVCGGEAADEVDEVDDEVSGFSFSRILLVPTPHLI